MHIAPPSIFTRVSSRVLPVVVATLSLAACFDSDRPGSTAGAQSGAIPVSSTGATPSNSAPLLSGVPVAAIPAGFPYVFKPSATDPEGDPLTFSIKGLPVWATFDAATGELRGTPTESDLGESGGIVISATDGKATTSFGPFKVSVNRPSNASVPAGARPPTIGGTPATTVAAGTGYAFQAVATDPDGDRLTFAARNLPSWLGLNTANGLLTGTPSTAQVGTYSNITISVTDGGSIVSLAPFSITVTAPLAGSSAGTTTNGTATLSWTKPTQNADGSPLVDLAGYVVKYGTSAGALDKRVVVNDPSLARFTVQNLTSGTWYFTVVSYTTSGVESDLSQVVSKTII
jgi:hypothetical protein